MAQPGQQPISTPAHMPLIPPPAAGSAGGAEAPWGGGPADREAQPGQPWSALPWHGHRLAAWCPACRVTTGALASPGVDGLPLRQMREARGCAVALGHARQVHHGPRRPHTERCAGRWRPPLPRDGWCAAALRPATDMGPLRRVLRHRDPLRRLPGKPRQHRPQALAHLPRPRHGGGRERHCHPQSPVAHQQEAPDIPLS
jgi:hypothetical protein